MNKFAKCILLFTAGIMGVVGPLCAQETQAAQQPIGLGVLPREARWEVSFELLRPTDGGGIYTVKIVSNRDASNRQDTYHWSDGTMTETWFVPYRDDSVVMMQERREPPNSGILFLQLDSETPENPAKTWPELEWVRPETAVGLEKLNGVECVIHETKAGEEGSSNFKAWIRKDNGLPLQFEDGKFRRRYQYLGAPAPFSLPERFQERMREHRAKVEQERKRSLLIP
ncbi:MAG: hypothetical protein SNJ84_03670 [Verrucomicrobiia bacterium]